MVADEIIVELIHENIDSEVSKWKYVVIVYVIGGSLTIGAMERFIVGQGSFYVKSKVYYHNDGYFMVNFASLEERNMVMYSGPHMLNNRPVVVKQWTVDFGFDEEDLKTIPICVNLPNLPLSCWSASALSKIGSGLGQPIYADACTSNTERISYARILVEVDVTKELPKSIKVKDPKGRVMVQEVWYEWKPSYCAKCMQIGHNCQQQQQNKAVMDKKTGQQQQRASTKQRTEYKPINTGSTIQSQHHLRETSQYQNMKRNEECSTSRGVEFAMIGSYAQLIHGVVKSIVSKNGFQFFAVRGLNNVHDRKALWDIVRNIEKQAREPWLLMGDFNSIPGAEDRMQGRDVQHSETNDFREVVEECNLAELPTIGRSYIWTNSHVFSRIDRAFVNDKWMLNMPHRQVHVMNPLFSDHSPLGIKINVKCDTKRRPFKFYNYMADHPEFGQIVENNWK
ncbi:PREDICTED: uncharacterized protein LOC109235874 [Nicotiana attenuata]|uniref:uncharacterized protein LOC109235874 n=1 Tax=Nicotiana attenuata TaxID=49451 RepID=UPI00090472C6|nr:PREDICTED: uncharacterized protein LOC109235874 [Nicotiana attenuata]